MTSISPTNHNAISTAIDNNIKLYENEKGSKELTATLIDNLGALQQLQREYQSKIEEIRNIVALYKLVTDLARKNVRNAKKWKKGAKKIGFIKANILFQNINSIQKSTELGVDNTSIKPSAVGL